MSEIVHDCPLLSHNKMTGTTEMLCSWYCTKLEQPNGDLRCAKLDIFRIKFLALDWIMCFKYGNTLKLLLPIKVGYIVSQNVLS